MLDENIRKTLMRVARFYDRRMVGDGGRLDSGDLPKFNGLRLLTENPLKGILALYRKE